VTVPAGNFSYTYNATSVENTSVRAVVTIGFAGDIIKNPASWNVPKVDIPEGIEKVYLS